MDNLTNEAQFLLSSMYNVYLTRRKEGKTRKESMYFGSLEEVHSQIMPEWQLEDVKSVFFELKKYNFLSGTPASNTVWYIALQTEAVAMLETTFKDKMDSALAFAAKIKNAIPFI